MLLSLVLALSGFLGSHYVIRNHITSIIIAAILGVIPLLHLFLKKKKRMEKFERQLPEGLELIARALRAGHAFTTGMKLAADEFDDPLGPEFDETLEEINLGVSVHDALKSLTYRIDCPDLKYFVVSVILQRETGGNLAEIMESIARIIRERFKLHGKIRILAAEGKLSAAVLLGLPFVVVIALKFINPEYIETLFSEDIGIIMVAISSFMMFIGILVMRKIIRIKV
jgi:tight adherence protein B